MSSSLTDRNHRYPVDFVEKVKEEFSDENRLFEHLRANSPHVEQLLFMQCGDNIAPEWVLEADTEKKVYAALIRYAAKLIRQRAIYDECCMILERWA